MSLLLMAPALAHGQRCVVDVVVLNMDRTARGPISVECSRPHTVPFGNWGAEFPYFGTHRLRDGYQFSGWKVEDGWLQWNSCTTGSDFLPPNRSYYNSDGGTAQVAVPNVVNVVDARRDHSSTGPNGMTCAEMAGSQVLEFGATEALRLELFELDRRIPPFDGPDYITTLEYGRILVQYTCDDGGWDCHGESRWVEPVSEDGPVYARLKLKVHLHRE